MHLVDPQTPGIPPQTPLLKLFLGRDVCRRMASSSSRVKKARDGIFRHRRAATSAPFLPSPLSPFAIILSPLRG